MKKFIKFVLFASALAIPVRALCSSLGIAIASLVFFALDRLSKVVIIDRLDLATLQRLPAWPPYLNFVMAWNKGANFGFLDGYDARWLLVAISVIVSAALMSWHARGRDGR